MAGRGELITLAREAIERWKKNAVRCGTLEGMARLLDLASKPGRVSSGLSLEPLDQPQEEDAAFMIQIEVALEKIHGRAEPQRRGDAEVIDVISTGGLLRSHPETGRSAVSAD